MNNYPIKAKLRRGAKKQIDKVVTVHQYANDWFTLIEYPRKTFSPSSLAFTAEGMKRIMHNEHKGIMLTLYEPYFLPTVKDEFAFSFKKRKRYEAPEHRAGNIEV